MKKPFSVRLIRYTRLYERNGHGMKTVKRICIAVLAAYLLGLLSPFPADTDIYSKIIRLHIIADSDSEEDQELKLALRDAVLERFGADLAGCSDREEAGELIRGSLDEIEEYSRVYVCSRGKEYPVSAEYSKEYYPTREYDGVRLPAGDYDSLRISIGRGEGKNWWCVIFPALCVDSASARKKLAEAGFYDEQIRILTDNKNPKYVLKFRILELYGEAVRKIREIRSKALS